MIERLWSLLLELRDYLGSNFDPFRDTIDILLVTLGIYWLLVLIRGTRAVQILVGLIVLLTASAASNLLNLVALRLILDNFLGSAAIILVILFQHDLRRALARVGRGFFPSVSAREESQIVEEVVRAQLHCCFATTSPFRPYRPSPGRGVTFASSIVKM